MNLRTKNGQIQMTETIAVLFIFFIIVLFAIIFYYKFQEGSLREKQEELLGAKAVETSLRTTFFPELTCSLGEAEPEANCFDIAKLDAVNKTLTKYLDSYYFEIFSYAKISVKEIYPGNNNWTLYNKEKPGRIKKKPTFQIIALKDDLASELETKYRYGYVQVEVYS